MLVKFTCGCVGLVGVTDGPVVIHPCDLNDPECWEPLGLRPRPSLADKGYEPLPAAEAEALLKRLNNLIWDGYRLRRIRSALQT
jgi:hypothetical protein